MKLTFDSDDCCMCDQKQIQLLYIEIITFVQIQHLISEIRLRISRKPALISVIFIVLAKHLLFEINKNLSEKNDQAFVFSVRRSTFRLSRKCCFGYLSEF